MAILQISKEYHKTFQIVDYTMTNIQKISLSKIVGFVPESEIWRVLKFVRCADDIYNFRVLQIGRTVAERTRTGEKIAVCWIWRWVLSFL